VEIEWNFLRATFGISASWLIWQPFLQDVDGHFKREHPFWGIVFQVPCEVLSGIVHFLWGNAIFTWMQPSTVNMGKAPRNCVA